MEQPNPPSNEIHGNPPDAALVHAAWRGDPSAQTAIWRRYLPLVRRRMSRSLGEHDVDDHVQDVFLNLFHVLGGLRDPSALRSFIIGITLHVAGTELRRRRSRYWLQLTTSGELPEPPPAHDEEPPREAVARLSAILDSFEPETSRVIALRYVEGKELTEVAETIEVSLATAKRHLARASARLLAIVRREPLLAGYLDPGSACPARPDLASAVH